MTGFFKDHSKGGRSQLKLPHSTKNKNKSLMQSVFNCVFSSGWCLCAHGDEPHSSDACSASTNQCHADVEQPVRGEAAAQGDRRRCFQDLRTLGQTEREPKPCRSVRD